MTASVSYERVEEFLTKDEKKYVFQKKNQHNPSISLENVSFKYDTKKEDSYELSDISFKIDKPTLEIVVGIHNSFFIIFI